MHSVESNYTFNYLKLIKMNLSEQVEEPQIVIKRCWKNYSKETLTNKLNEIDWQNELVSPQNIWNEGERRGIVVTIIAWRSKGLRFKSHRRQVEISTFFSAFGLLWLVFPASIFSYMITKTYLDIKGTDQDTI